MPINSKFSRGPFFWAHILWAAVCVAVSILMITSQGGHPPLIIFLPVVLVAWPLGHLVIWGIRRLARWGRGRSNNSESWPPMLHLTLIGTGSGTLFGIYQLAALIWGKQIFANNKLWIILMIIWVIHGLCFSAILLRLNGSRFLAASLYFGWAGLLGWQIQQYLVTYQKLIAVDILIGFGVVSLLVFLGIHLLTSKRINRFLDGSLRG